MEIGRELAAVARRYLGRPACAEPADRSRRAAFAKRSAYGSSAISTSVPGGVKRREIERNEPRLGDLAVGHSVHAGGAPRNAPPSDCRLAVGELDEHVLPLDRSALAYRERSGRQRPPVQEVRE